MLALCEKLDYLHFLYYYPFRCLRLTLVLWYHAHHLLKSNESLKYHCSQYLGHD